MAYEDESRKVGRKLPHLNYAVDKGKNEERPNKRKGEKEIRRIEKMKKEN